MPLSANEVTEAYEVYLSYEMDANGEKLPTLWDPENGRKMHNAVRAVWLVGTLPDMIEVHTDPETVAGFLDPEEEL